MSNQPAIAINIKEVVLIESGHRCAVCGEGCRLEKARFVSWRKTPEVAVEDVICLCERCHGASERENWSEERFREYKARPWIKRVAGSAVRDVSPVGLEEAAGRPAITEWSVADLLEHCSRRPPDDIVWKEFVRRYNATIKSSVVKTFYTKAREETDRKPQFPEDLVEDLVQSVYMRLVEDRNRALDRFEGEHENSIYQYLAMISINVVKDYFREMRAQKRPKVSFSLDALLESSGDSPLLNQTVGRLDGKPMFESDLSFVMEEVEYALKRSVSGKNRERDILIFKLRFIEGLTLEEITRVMNLDISAISVGSILNRILKKVRPLLDPPGRSR
ncbi:MAG TPA: sigma-70 family RNA polymerase sigma factor [Blastocatellia bacterium]|jgi:RNA polymerase sigma factor (sigma-70 family)|nr:sigma-70 family RNA polymerase sigma factor [Blastocatellia bacterium]